MTNLIKHKRVEFSELFYDLVFVYAISKTTALIHHLHHGILSLDAIFGFLMTLLVLVNCWMIQTVYTNRYGKNSLFNMVVMFINMAMLLLISNMITNNWQSYFHTFCWTVGTLTLTLFFQYLVEYLRKTTTAANRKSIKGFLWMTGLRTLAIYIAALLPISVAIYVYMLGILLTFIMPVILTQRARHFQINLPHLIERISLLVIITFGEMIMGLANFFTVESFSIHSILYFIIMVNLFMNYFGQFDHAIDEEGENKGIFLIYSHYPILIGLIMVTVSMSFLVNPEVHHLFATGFFYTGIGLFQAAILANGYFNKSYLKYDKLYYGLQTAFFLIGLVLSLLFSANPTIVITIATVMTLAMEVHFIHFYMTRTKKFSSPDWELY
ncbi:low temperature requirement protein A [Streptococcus parasanguinis]|uniref:low temperature requirement protein A n=1 Tax=Streptococcus parasanguinis TaxID=1318 RepID=UPI001BDA2876|nr:low temperature requirement protein A [Streptococcus parasanguinis]MBT0924370.1 low temperature requirement protein A [Streptococcus parasanguinis]